MIDFQKLGVNYRLSMTEAARSRALADRTVTNTAGKAMTSIVVGGKSGAKALVMTAAQFEQFKKGFVA